jgi:hypothetical protein
MPTRRMRLRGDGGEIGYEVRKGMGMRKEIEMLFAVARMMWTLKMLRQR